MGKSLCKVEIIVVKKRGSEVVPAKRQTQGEVLDNSRSAVLWTSNGEEDSADYT